jgi:hypothetical protein
MGNIKTVRMVIGALALLGAASFLPFTNCSQNPQSASTPHAAFLSPDEKIKSLKSEFSGRIPISFCESSEAYGCMKKVYSREIASEQKIPMQECAFVSNEIELCPVVQTFHFNSEAAEENCNGCEETYEYTDYSCHLKIPNQDNVYPIVFTELTLDQSLSNLHQFCSSLVEVR